MCVFNAAEKWKNKIEIILDNTFLNTEVSLSLFLFLSFFLFLHINLNLAFHTQFNLVTFIPILFTYHVIILLEVEIGKIKLKN